MCGLVGFFGGYSKKHDDAFQDLLIIDSIRGPHSTGVVFVPQNQDSYDIAKAACLPQELPYFTDYRKLFNRLNVALLGHNRYATIGKITDENAHPFGFDHIAGMHNGTIRNKWKLPDGRDFDTDSEAIMYSLALQGIDETYKLIEGAAALVWWDGKEKSVNFVQNGERPLTFAHTKDNRAVFYASESWMLRAVSERHKLELVDILKPKDHFLWTFTYDGKEVKASYRKLVPLSKTTPIRYTQQHRGSIGNDYGTRWDQFWREKQKKEEVAKQLPGETPKQAKARRKAEKKARREAQKAAKENQQSLSFQERSPNKHNIICRCQECNDYWSKQTPNNTNAERIALSADKPLLNYKKAEEIPPAKRLTLLKPDGGKAIDTRAVFGDVYITKKEFEERYKECSFCGCDLHFEDDKIAFLDKDEAACNLCYQASAIYNIPREAIH